MNLKELQQKYMPKKAARQFYIRLITFLTLVYLIPHALRLTAHLLNLTPKYTATYMYTYLFIIAVLVLLIIKGKEKIEHLPIFRQSWIQTLLFGYFALIFYAIFFYTKYYSNIISVMIYINRYLLLDYIYTIIAAIFLSLAIFNIPTLKRFRVELTTSFSASLLFLIFTLSLRSNWRIFSTTLTKTAYFFLQFIFPTHYTLNGDPTLYVKDFSASIGSACSGIEGLSLFAGLFVLMIFLDFDTINLRKVPLFFIIGELGMFLVSIIRITSLFFIGVYYPNYALNMFHTNIGWILFITYFMVFLYLIYPRLKKSPQKKPDTI